MKRTTFHLLSLAATLVFVSGCASLPGYSSPSPASTKTDTAKTSTRQEKETSYRVAKSKDGKYEGRIYGTPPANAKFSKIMIGMSQYQVEKLIGNKQDIKYATNWGKAWIPFYAGTDARRQIWFYDGQGTIAFDTDSAYAEGGKVVEVIYDPKMEW